MTNALCVWFLLLPGDIGEGMLSGSGGLQAKRVVSVHGGGCGLNGVIDRYTYMYHAFSVIPVSLVVLIISVCVCVYV